MGVCSIYGHFRSDLFRRRNDLLTPLPPAEIQASDRHTGHPDARLWIPSENLISTGPPPGHMISGDHRPSMRQSASCAINWVFWGVGVSTERPAHDPRPPNPQRLRTPPAASH